MDPLLGALATFNRQALVIQIGANEDSRRNPLRDMFFRSRWRGVIVDPLPLVAERLYEAYGHLSRVSVEQAAIAPLDGEQPFYYDSCALKSDRRQTATDFSLPGALRREILYLAPTYHSCLDECIAEMVVPCLTFESLCRRRRIEKFDVLRIDTAGDEAEVLEQVDLARFQPTLIVYNHALLGTGVKQACDARLTVFGYESFEDAGYTWCFGTRALPASRARVLSWIWRLSRMGCAARNRSPGGLRHAIRSLAASTQGDGPKVTRALSLTEEERRYLATGYDDRVQLPAGAASYLVGDNPRLVALRREYASLDYPAMQHHLWHSGRVEGNVNLQYFRGDNLYLWHYAEHPRAMALKLFLYMRHLEDRGGKQLLELLSEDGSFGCWTTEVAGYGQVSRDLLDSVNEILFLERHLALLEREKLRVLDIGAGYGRLGYRMAVALPGLADYCCTDAVAESTFLADYYLRLRGCSPLARALPLGEVPSLKPGAFDLAVNVHSFSECTIEAIRWWVDVIRRLRIPWLFVVPNEADGILSREPDGRYHSVIPVLESAGYVPTVKERAISDRATREILMLNDNFYLFSLVH